MLRLFFLIIISGVSFSDLCAQDGEHNAPIFNQFKGTVYKVPASKLSLGYRPEVYQYEKIKDITWDKIDVSNRKVDEGFPDIDMRTGFGIIFKSRMNIPKDGYYKFSISSDDGSIIWIDGGMVVNNDYSHGMTEESSVVQLLEGNHEVKIWYYQAYEDRYGVQFDAKFLKEIPKEKQLPRVITIQDEVLFDHDKYNISSAANYTLDSLTNIISEYENVIINIDGHTDNTGTDSYNMELSQKRSKSVMDALMIKNMGAAIQYLSDGHGYHQPVATNNTEEGRQQNRRVVITIRKDGSNLPYFKEKLSQ